MPTNLSIYSQEEVDAQLQKLKDELRTELGGGTGGGDTSALQAEIDGLKTRITTVEGTLLAIGDAAIPG